jgi:LCP family protein required for cell wall assembly
MRTTLKRGIGRGGALNGNGRAMLPPAAHTPVAVYRLPDPPHRSRWKFARRFLGWFVVGVAMLAVGLLGGAYLYFHESVAQIRAHSVDVKTAQKRLAIPLPGQAAIALIIGYDHRADEGNGAPSRSDTVMLMRADPQTKSITMLSLPRDLIVTVVCPGRGRTRQKINYAYAWCGSKGTVETVKELTGLPINYLITVNFRAFKQVVNRLGGVWIDVDHHYYNSQGGPNGYAKINLSPGYQRLTGGAALDYVRFRHTDSDFFRVARQQQFVKAVRYQLKHKFNLTTLPSIVNALNHNVEIGVGGSGELSGSTILSYARFIYQLPAGGFYQAKIDAAEGYSEVRASASSIQSAVQQFSSPDTGAAAAAATVGGLDEKPKPTTAKPKPKAPAAPVPGETTLTVLNGNGIAGSASNASYLLGQRGYKVVVPVTGKPANAPTWSYFRTKVYFDTAQSGSKAAATAVSNLFGGADVEQLPGSLGSLSGGAMLTVVVGQTFHNTLAPGVPVRRIPQRQAPALRDTPSSVEALLREVKAPFRLLTPSVIEANSVSSGSTPVRVYSLDSKHRAVRLVFRQGSGQYWGIQMTDWTKAPILADRSFRRILRGRIYDLYYSGSRLHMVVLRWGGATYWVVNTLLDNISNETMFEIAKGLRPLRSA